MCNHLDISKTIIEEITHHVYPAIEMQFIQINAENNEALLEELMNKLQNEFRALVNCEKMMVFPSVLKIFNKEREVDQVLPNLIDLMQLTRNKEAKIAILITDLKHFLNQHAECENFRSVNSLIHLFEASFFPMKIKWNQMIDERSKTCACFQIYTSNTLNQIRNESREK